MQLQIKLFLFALLFLPISFSGKCQEQNWDNNNRFFFYWGWNRSAYTPSDIRFKGEQFDFTLEKVKAKDRQTPFAIDPYFHPLKITIPQVNYAIGYYINSKTTISIGVDHMKYIADRTQTANITGNINGTSYNGNYTNQPIQLGGNFLWYEHTDGLNYVFIEVSKNSVLSKAKNWGKIYFSKGISFAGMYPKTRIHLLDYPGYDEYNLTGYGCAFKLGTKFELWKKLFFTNEMKFGYIHMPHIPISNVKGEFASQQFCFFQTSILFGFAIDCKKKVQKNTN